MGEEIRTGLMEDNGVMVAKLNAQQLKDQKYAGILDGFNGPDQPGALDILSTVMGNADPNGGKCFPDNKLGDLVAWTDSRYLHKGQPKTTDVRRGILLNQQSDKCLVATTMPGL